LFDLVFRAAATQATKDAFAGIALDWRRADCYRVAASHAARFRHSLPLPKYRSERGAYRQMKREGYTSLDDLLDQFLTPIAPAQMMLGDIAIYDGPGLFGGGLLISCGRKLIGFYEGLDMLVNIEPDDVPRGAWRV
jgi:hypothetical protein